MDTDPNKNDEIKDEALDNVSGGSETMPPDEEPTDNKPTAPTDSQKRERI